MKRKYRKFVFLLGLSILVGCTTSPQSTTLFLQEEKYNEEEKTVAKRLGYLEEPLIFHFKSDSPVKMLSYTLYTLEEGQWQQLNQHTQTLSGKAGRISFLTDQLTLGYTILLQCDNQCIKDQIHEEQIKSSDDSFLLTSFTISEEIEFEFNQEIPVLLQAYSHEALDNAISLNTFFAPEQFVQSDAQAWVMTLTFYQAEEDNSMIKKIDQ